MFRTVVPLSLSLFVGVLSVGAGPALAQCAAFSAARPLYKEARYAEAVTQLTQAVREEPKEARVRYLLGLTYSKTGRFVDAARSFEEARQLDPGIRFTQRAKFEDKLKRALKLAKAVSPAGQPPSVGSPDVPTPAAPPPVGDDPRGALGAPLAAALQAQQQAQQQAPGAAPPSPTAGRSTLPVVTAPAASSSSSGPPLWVLIVLGVAGAFLVFSFVRQARQKD